MKVEIRQSAFEPWQEIYQYQQQMTGLQAKYGATAVFVGTMRDFNNDKQVKQMYLDYYPGMTEKILNEFCQQVIEVPGVLDLLLIHRAGEILPDESIVLIAIWSEHRKQAFEKSRELMENLKSKVPFWKKEITMDGKEVWVEKNTAGF